MRRNRDVDNLIDQFYTPQEIAKNAIKLIADLCKYHNSSFIDTSAGDGFVTESLKLHSIPTLAFDIQPDENALDVLQKDFLEVKAIPGSNVVGFNPPFGFKGGTVTKFVKHAVKITQVTAFVFIVPYVWSERSIPGFVQTYMVEQPMFPGVSRPLWMCVWERPPTMLEPILKNTPPELPKGIEGIHTQSKREYPAPAMYVRAIGVNSGKIGAFRTVDEPFWETFDGNVIENPNEIFGSGGVKSFSVIEFDNNVSMKDMRKYASNIMKHSEKLSRIKTSLKKSDIVDALL